MAAGEQREAPSSKAFSASEFARSPSQAALTPILSASVIRPDAVPFQAALQATVAEAMEDDSQPSAPQDFLVVWPKRQMCLFQKFM